MGGRKQRKQVQTSVSGGLVVKAKEIRREPWDTWGHGQVLFVDGRDLNMLKC